MEVKTRFIKNDNHLLISVSGDFVFHGYREFNLAYTALPVKPAFVTVDLSETHALDSAALGMLLLLQDYAGAGKVFIYKPSPQIKRTLDLTNMTDMFSTPFPVKAA